MKHLKYNSIDNVTNKGVERAKNIESRYFPDGLKWNVTEKVHGSNFSIYGDRDIKLRYAKRSTFLSDGSNFYNFQRAVDRNKENIEWMIGSVFEYAEYADYKPEFEDIDLIESVSLHFEICGGSYPDVDRVKNVKTVQREIKYSNDIQIICFDIRINYVGGITKYLPHSKVVELCNKFDVHVLPILFTGTLTECLIFSKEHVEDESEVWKIFGMDNAVEKNVREGHVIKPNQSLFDAVGSRLILKDKSEKFKENSGAKDKLIRPKFELSISGLRYMDVAETFICLNRVNAVTSKMGEYTIKDFQEVMIQLAKDVITDMDREHSEWNEQILPLEKAEIKRTILKKCGKFMGINKRDIF